MAKTESSVVKPLTAKSYFLQEHLKCCKFLLAYKQKRTNENLHQLRVSIKKIKAVIVMAEKISHQSILERHFSGYKIIFKKAGVIREIALQQKHLAKNSVNLKLKNANRSELIKLKKEFIASTPQLMKDVQNNKQQIEKSMALIPYKEIKSYCRQRIKKLPKQWKKVKNKEEVHGFRKKIKHVLYCSQLLNTDDRTELISAKKITQIDKLQNLIGKWHDRVVLLQKMQTAHLNTELKNNPLKLKTKQLLSKIKREGKIL